MSKTSIRGAAYTLEVTQQYETFRTIQGTVPDPSWSKTIRGITYRWSDDQTTVVGAVAKSETYWCHDCHDEHTRSWWETPSGQAIEPGRMPDPDWRPVSTIPTIRTSELTITEYRDGRRITDTYLGGEMADMPAQDASADEVRAWAEANNFHWYSTTDDPA